MRILASVLLATTALATLGHAEMRKAAPNDSQIRVVSYSATKRVEIVGTIGQPTTITFPVSEDVLRVIQSGLPGTKAAWEANQLPEECSKANPPKGCFIGNNLTLWPSKVGSTSMTVITTTANGQQKPYAFRMVANPAPEDADDPDPRVTLNLLFKGGMARPDPPVDPPAARAIKVRRQAHDQEISENTLRTNTFQGVDLTCHYRLKGKPHSPIAPLCPIDNGQWTAFRFPGLSDKPAIYAAVGPHDCGYKDGEDEQLVRQHGAGDYVVVEQIAPKFCLRLGQSVIEVLNTAYNPAGNPTGTGTLAPNVERDIIQPRDP